MNTTINNVMSFLVEASLDENFSVEASNAQFEYLKSQIENEKIRSHFEDLYYIIARHK